MFGYFLYETRNRGIEYRKYIEELKEHRRNEYREYLKKLKNDKKIEKRRR